MKRFCLCSDCWKNGKIEYSCPLYHVVENTADGIEIKLLNLCTPCVRKRERFDIEYLNAFKKFEDVPENLLSKSRLREIGLKPVSAPCGRYYKMAGHVWILVYDKNEAVPIKVDEEKQYEK